MKPTRQVVLVSDESFKFKLSTRHYNRNIVIVPGYLYHFYCVLTPYVFSQVSLNNFQVFTLSQCIMVPFPDYDEYLVCLTSFNIESYHEANVSRRQSYNCETWFNNRHRRGNRMLILTVVWFTALSQYVKCTRRIFE